LTNRVHYIGCSRDSGRFSWPFVGRRPIRDKAETLALQNLTDLHPIGTELMTQNTRD
jgi:hypothetical protein